MIHYDVLIVGGGHAGAQSAIALRQGGYAGSLAIASAETELPYERPPLSKEYLAGDKSFERLLLRPAGFWWERGIAMHLGTKVERVEPTRHRVTAADGTAIEYGTLIWATGGSPRRLSCSGADLPGVHSVRTRADVDVMVAQLPSVQNIVIIGGGYIGLEAAAIFSKFGKHVTLLEALDRTLSRVAGEPLSRFYEAEHRAHGVDIRLGAAVECVLGTQRTTGVRLATGETLDADMVIVGIGIVPAVEPLIAAGAQGGNGVLVDNQCRTTLADIFAIGDCALHANRFARGDFLRLESVQNANDQANVVARTILGEAAGYEAVPWFWSNQYDLKLQTVGLSAGHDDILIRGEPGARSFALLYLRNDRLIAIDAVNAVKDYAQGRRLVADGARLDRSRAVDPAVALRDAARDDLPS